MEYNRNIYKRKLLFLTGCSTSANIQEMYAEEISKFKAIGSKNISCIITTNYDTFLENSFGQGAFQTYIGQSELLFSTITRQLN